MTASNSRQPDPDLNSQNTAGRAPEPAALAGFFLESEAAFYGRYAWCLNPYPLIEEVMGHLRAEVGQLGSAAEPWQTEEMLTNIFLLACAISDTADDCLSGKRYDFSGKAPRALAPLAAIPAHILNARQRFAQSRLDTLRPWRAEWEEALHRLLQIHVRPGALASDDYMTAARHLLARLEGEFPLQFARRRINSPRAFRSQDYSSHDTVTLAGKFCAQHANPDQPCLVVGMRTAGSYFGPLIRACLADRGYRETGIITLRPKGGVSPTEMQKLKHWADRGGAAIVIDEPVYQGGTLASCIRLLRKAGFPASSIHALFPVHPAGRNWHRSDAAIAFSGCRMVTIEPEETFKSGRLRNDLVEQTLRPYFAKRGWPTVQVIEDDRSAGLNGELDRTSDQWFRTRLKRVYAVRLTAADGATETRYVIAKSIGWGWAGYQAFFAARSLERFIPPVLGLRDGILFSEWVGSGPPALDSIDRAAIVRRLAEYVAARVQGLGFPDDPSPDLCRARLQLGMDMLGTLLFSVYRSSRLARLKRHWIGEELARLSSPAAALLDGKMQVNEWVRTDAGLLKTDYEQHGMGRMDFSFTDPAYDLSAGILAFELSQQEEADLLAHYAAQSGDTGIAERLPLYKLMAGLATMDSAYQLLGHERLTARHAELNRAYINAWTFSMIQMARVCASQVPRSAVRKDGPLVFCDVDGVIDQPVFKFPTTTPSGIRALSLLTGHGLPVYLDTARSAHDVVEYCAAYGFKAKSRKPEAISGMRPRAGGTCWSVLIHWPSWNGSARRSSGYRGSSRTTFIASPSRRTLTARTTPFPCPRPC